MHLETRGTAQTSTRRIHNMYAAYLLLTTYYLLRRIHNMQCTVSAASAASMRGSGLIEPSACGMPLTMAAEMSETTFPKSTCSSM